MPGLAEKKDPNMPKGLDLRSAATEIGALMGKDNNVNKTGTKSRALDESVGRDMKGRFQKAPPADDASQDDDTAPAEDIEDVVTGEDESADDTADDAVDRAQDDTADTETDDSDKADASEADAAPLETLSDLAEALGVSVADLSKQIKHTFKAAGEDVTATLAELESGYQREVDYQRGKTKLAEERRAFENENRQRIDAYVAQSHVLAQSFNVTEQLIVAEMNSPRMMALRTQDPNEWGARQLEFRDRLAVLGQARNNAAAQYENYQKTQRAELLTRERSALTEAVKDWGPEKDTVARKTMASIGYTDPEIAQVLDSRLIRGALELAELRAYKAAAEAAKAKAVDTTTRIKKDVPKLMKPTKPAATGVSVKQGNLQQLRRRLNKSHSTRDAAALIERMI